VCAERVEYLTRRHDGEPRCPRFRRPGADRRHATPGQDGRRGLHPRPAPQPYRGFSVEFAEYRQYSPGDEIKHIDWKVFGKTDRYYIKQFEEETNLACHIILDASGSMGYGSQENRSKLRYGACMAACLAYFMIRQRDATGLMVFDSQVRTVLRARRQST